MPAVESLTHSATPPPSQILKYVRVLHEQRDCKGMLALFGDVFVIVIVSIFFSGPKFQS